MSSEDIKIQLPEDSQRFCRIDADFKVRTKLHNIISLLSFLESRLTMLYVLKFGGAGISTELSGPQRYAAKLSDRL
jgi:hypothetical protein